MVFFNTMIELAFVSIVVSLFNQFVQRKFGSKKQLKSHQDKMKEKQSRIKELMQKDDEKSKQEREGLEKEMLESMNTVMKPVMKTMVVSMIVILPVFFLLGSIYGEEVIDLPVPIPWLGTAFDLFTPFSWIELYNQTSWVGWYILISLIFSLLILSPLIKIYDNLTKKDEKDSLESDTDYKKKMEGMK